MGRKRLIDSDVFTSGDLIDQPAWVRLLWIGLVIHTDRRGYVRDNPAFFGGTLLSCLRIRRARIVYALDTLVSRRCIERVILEGVNYLKITNFKKHQRFRGGLDGAELKGKEGKGIELKGKEQNPEPLCPPPKLEKAIEPNSVERQETYLTDGPQIDRLQKRFEFGKRRAVELVFQHKYTVADLDDWEVFAKTHEPREVSARIQAFKNPSEVPAEKNTSPKNGGAFGRTSEFNDPEKWKGHPGA